MLRRISLLFLILLVLSSTVFATDVMQTQADLLQTDSLYRGLDDEAKDLLG